MEEKKIKIEVSMTVKELDALQFAAWWMGSYRGIPIAGKSRSEAAQKAWDILMREFYRRTNETKEAMGDAAGIDE